VGIFPDFKNHPTLVQTINYKNFCEEWETKLLWQLKGERKEGELGSIKSSPDQRKICYPSPSRSQIVNHAAYCVV
jgi:hypothetical protein